ncbi:MAG: hypothetical protein Q7S33_01540 [Nanoarchaeota archaeon]|nr:hypothetical protein [Nanoarchaeota archaeon]
MNTKNLFNKKGRKAVFQIANLCLAIFAFTILISLASAPGENTYEGFMNQLSSTPTPVSPSVSTSGSSIQDGVGSVGILGTIKGIGWKAIAKSISVIAASYTIGKLIGDATGKEGAGSALGTSAALGTATYQILSASAAVNPMTGNGILSGIGATIKGTPGLSWLVAHPVTAAITVAIVSFIVLSKSEKQKTMTFTCQAWQAPKGGTNCDLCNKNSVDFPCTEYRCKSLGASCKLINIGSKQQKCVWNNKNDITPPVITPDTEELSAGYKYTDVNPNPPGPGFRIIGDSQECVKAFTPLKLGIKTNEQAQCKIDVNNSMINFSQMGWYMNGNSAEYSDKFIEQFNLPGPANLQGENLTIDNGGKWTFYIKCSDANGNENSAAYAVRFCVDPSPDTTAPNIEKSSILSGSCVAENQNSADVEFYTNEPADCKWSSNDREYDLMENTMTCSSGVSDINSLQLYTCNANLGGISRDLTTFYVKCKDKLGNTMQQSKQFSLRGSGALKINDLMPNETIFGSIDPAPVELSVRTSYGCENGNATCSYSRTGNENDYIEFFETNEIFHKQKLYLTTGSYTYYYKCSDSGGNVAKGSTNFNVEIDTTAPVVARVYEENNKLKVITVRNSECIYSFDNCDFSFNENGVAMTNANETTHFAEWKQDKTYYIKCRDEFRSETADCSIIVKPSKNFLI